MAWTRTAVESSVQGKQSPGDPAHWIGLGVAAIFVAGGLAMVATWFLADSSPIPADDTNLGLLGVLFVIFLDLVLVFGFAVSQIRQGQGMAAIKRSIGLILLGLLAASVVGSLPWLWHRLTTALPWVHDIPWEGLTMLGMAAYSLLRGPRPVQDGHRLSRGKLIAHVSLIALVVASSLFVAVGKLSDGQTWLGAIYLAVALMFGFLGAKILLRRPQA